MTHKHWIALLLGALATLALLAARPARAAGVVGTGTAASCSEAALVAALGGGGLVTFNCGGPATITLSAERTIIQDTTIDGGGLITLSGGNATRLFFSGGGVRLTLSNITLRDGISPVGGGLIEASGAQVTLDNVRLLSSAADASGGAIYCYVDTGGTLTIRGSTFKNNTAASGGAIYNDGCATTISDTVITGSDGGAIYTAGPLALSNTTISGNSGGGLHVASGGSATLSGGIISTNTNTSNGGDGGGVYVASGGSASLNAVTISANTAGHGGGIESSGVLTVSGSLIRDNEVTGSGGGIWNLGGKLWVENSTISGNAAYEGGGINSYGSQVDLYNVNVTGNRSIGGPGGGIYHGAGVFYVTNATISANLAVGPAADGGGLYIGSDDNATLMNVTLSGNQAGQFGGGLYHQSRYAVLVNVTIAGNNADSAGDAIYENAAPTAENPGILQIGSSVIFGSSSNCSGGMFESFGHNVVAGGCPALNHASDQHVSPADLHMGELRFNGGAFPMQTILPLAGSPAIDAGNPADCPASDQRGAVRLGTCDAGAGEYGGQAMQALIPLLVK